MLDNPKQSHKSPLFLLIILLAIGLGIFWYSHHREQAVTGTRTSPLPTMSVAALAQQLINSDRLLVLDIRSKTDYLVSHIPSAVAMPYYEINLNDNQLQLFSDWPTVLVCANDSCPEINNAARDLKLIGFNDLKQLAGGFEAYRQANLTLASQAKLVQQDLAGLLNSIEVPSITVTELQKKMQTNNLQLIDSRTSFEFVTGFIPQAINIPLHAFGAAIEKKLIDPNKTIVVYDRKGNRSRIAVQALLNAGFKDVLDLKGGIESWNAAKLDLDLPAEDQSNLKELIPVLDSQ